MLLLGVAGATLFYGDSAITPAISVLGAMKGLEVVAPALEPYVVPATMVILAALDPRHGFAFLAAQAWAADRDRRHRADDHRRRHGALRPPADPDRLAVAGAARAGQVVTHRALLADVWGAEFVEHTHHLRIYVAQLRAKLEAAPADPQWLLTEPGVGYRLAESESEGG